MFSCQSAILLSLEPEWALRQEPMRLKAKWVIDSEAMRARGIIVEHIALLSDKRKFVVKSNLLIKKIERKQL